MNMFSKGLPPESRMAMIIRWTVAILLFVIMLVYISLLDKPEEVEEPVQQTQVIQFDTAMWNQVQRNVRSAYRLGYVMGYQAGYGGEEFDAALKRDSINFNGLHND